MACELVCYWKPPRGISWSEWSGPMERELGPYMETSQLQIYRFLVTCLFHCLLSHSFDG